MDLKSADLHWPRQNPNPAPASSLHSDVRCDVAVIGAGVTGALVAHALSLEGIQTVLLDKRGVAAGSTSASTALIQYEIDVPLFSLIRMRGKRDALRCYELCREAIDEIEGVVQKLDSSCHFFRRPSLYLAEKESDVPDLRLEYRARTAAGFIVEYLDRAAIRNQFPFSAPAALWSISAAEIDPCAFTQALVRDSLRAGLQVFAPVTVLDVESTRTGVTLRTASGSRIMARKLIVAAGYESTEFLGKRLVKLRSTYALTTQPLQPFPQWPDRCLIWEAGRPYHYLRTTDDNRIMIGGGDEDFANPQKRDALIGIKSRQLAKKLRQMFPGAKVVADRAWAGTFGDTKDGLPYIGNLRSARNVFFNLCYGANGINFAMIGAGIARNWVIGKRDRNRRLFALDRV